MTRYHRAGYHRVDFRTWCDHHEMVVAGWCGAVDLQMVLEDARYDFKHYPAEARQAWVDEVLAEHDDVCPVGHATYLSYAEGMA